MDYYLRITFDASHSTSRRDFMSVLIIKTQPQRNARFQLHGMMLHLVPMLLRLIRTHGTPSH